MKFKCINNEDEEDLELGKIYEGYYEDENSPSFIGFKSLFPTAKPNLFIEKINITFSGDYAEKIFEIVK